MEWAKNLMCTSKSKHIEMRHHFGSPCARYYIFRNTMERRSERRIWCAPPSRNTSTLGTISLREFPFRGAFDILHVESDQQHADVLRKTLCKSVLYYSRVLISRGRSGECLMCLQQCRGWCCIADVGDIYLNDVMLDFYDCRSAEPLVVLGNRHRSIADWGVIYR